jgi:hypothetical protein
VTAHPQYSVTCLAFVKWYRTAVAGGLGTNHPFRAAQGYPESVVMDAALGHSRNAIRLLVCLRKIADLVFGPYLDHNPDFFIFSST